MKIIRSRSFKPYPLSWFEFSSADGDIFVFLVSGFLVQKREKRRWIFRKPTSLSQESPKEKTENNVSVATAEQRHALDVAVATAEAAMATAQAAAVEVARLTRPSNHAREQQLQFAAIVIQTAFRGYLVIDLNLFV